MCQEKNEKKIQWWTKARLKIRIHVLYAFSMSMFYSLHRIQSQTVHIKFSQSLNSYVVNGVKFTLQTQWTQCEDDLNLYGIVVLLTDICNAESADWLNY